MKEIIIIAGPNGAGKTSFANAFLEKETNLVFVNADEAAQALRRHGYSGSAIDIAAGRRVLTLVGDLVEEGREFVVETTLATLTYARLIPRWKAAGYRVSLSYLRLATVEHCRERVRRRVAAGGHSIPDEVIQRRFVRGMDLLENVYKPIVDDWYVWNSLDGDFELIESKEVDR